MRKALTIGIITMMFFAWAAAGSAEARLKVVATLPWIGSVAEEIGGDRIDVRVLVKPNQDAHYMEAKPSMILAARNADLLMYNGLDLEIGYIPLIIESSRNPKIQPGQPGNFDCGRFVRVIDRPATADRSLGDIHPLGNPHYLFSPSNILRVARGMSETLATRDGANAEVYRSNFIRFQERLNEYQDRWNAEAPKGKALVAYHKYFEYLAREFGFSFMDYIESKPGIPPSAAHLAKLVAEIGRSRPGAIIASSASGVSESEALGNRSGVPVIVLPNDVGALPGTGNWFDFMDKTLSLLKQVK